jgi:carboxybiotin decarboxylase
MNRKKSVVLFFLTVLLWFFAGGISWSETVDSGPGYEFLPSMDRLLVNFGQSTGLFTFFFPSTGNWVDGIGRMAMVGIGLILLYLAIKKDSSRFCWYPSVLGPS